MTEAVWVTLIAGVFSASGLGIIKAILDYRRDRNKADPITVKEAAQASVVRAAEASGATPAITQAMLGTMLASVQADMEQKLAEQKKHHDQEMADLRREVSDLRQGITVRDRYIGQLREDIAGQGKVPREWPEELKYIYLKEN